MQEGTLAELRGHTLTAIHAVLERPARRAELPLLHDVIMDGDRLTATADSERIGEAMESLLPLGISSLTVEPPSLESLFLGLYDQADRGQS